MSGVCRNQSRPSLGLPMKPALPKHPMNIRKNYGTECFIEERLLAFCEGLQDVRRVGIGGKYIHLRKESGVGGVWGGGGGGGDHWGCAGVRAAGFVARASRPTHR